jgi:hypothetical protein
MMTDSGIQVVLRVLRQQFERLQCWNSSWEGFLKYLVEMFSGVMMHMLNLMTICSEIQLTLSVLPEQFQEL